MRQAKCLRGAQVEAETPVGGASRGASSSESWGAFTLLEEIREDDHLSPSKFIQIMHLDVGTFARNAKVHRNTVARAPAAPSVQTHIRDNIRVLRAAYDVAGRDVKNAIFWFKNEPLPEFDYKTAETLVAEGRADDVIRLLESYEAGAAG